MSISSVGASQVYQPQMTSSNKSNSLSADQLTLIEETLSQYDSSSLSADDAASIVEAFQEAGIEGSSALQSTMSDLGFDAKEIGDLANAGGAGVGQTGGGKPMGGPPPPPEEEELSTITELLESLLEESEEDEDTLTSGTTTSSSPYDDDTSFTSFNTILDYTNQIVNLKDDAKDEVMSILDEYNQIEDKEDVQKSIVSTLNEILNKPQNYNRISFYA